MRARKTRARARQVRACARNLTGTAQRWSNRLAPVLRVRYPGSISVAGKGSVVQGERSLALTKAILNHLTDCITESLTNKETSNGKTSCGSKLLEFRLFFWSKPHRQGFSPFFWIDVHCVPPFRVITRYHHRKQLSSAFGSGGVATPAHARLRVHGCRAEPRF